MIFWAGSYLPYDHELITVSNVVKTLTAAKYAIAGVKELRAILTLRDDQIYYYLDGTAADANANIMNPGDVIVLENSSQLALFRALRITGDAKLIVNYLKR